MNKASFTILSNVKINAGNDGNPDLSVWKMVLEGDTSHITAPGQFVNLALPGRFLRRPISICDWDGNTVTIVYRLVGKGTVDMSLWQAGQKVDMLCGLGNGFNPAGCAKPLLVGGGVGLPPMLGLAKSFRKRGVEPIIVAGFNTSADIMLAQEFAAEGFNLQIATMDGSVGAKGTVMEIVKNLDFDRFFACGPRPMLKALAGLQQGGQLSMEERMGCGYGVCMGCICQTAKGAKRVCYDGPVFEKEDILW